MLKTYPVLASVFTQAPSRFGPGWADQAVPNIEAMYGPVSEPLSDRLPHARGVGFDISQFSLDYTGKVIDAFGLGARYTLENRDVRHGYEVPADFLICQEVLEHLENPAEFCTWLYAMVRPGGHAYITAAL